MSSKNYSSIFDVNSSNFDVLTDLQYDYVKGRHRRKRRRSRECRTKNSIKYDFDVRGKMKHPHTFVSTKEWKGIENHNICDKDEILHLKNRESIKKYMKRFLNNPCEFSVKFDGFKGNHRKTFMGIWDSRLKKHLSKEYKQYRKWTRTYYGDIIVESRNSHLARKNFF